MKAQAQAATAYPPLPVADLATAANRAGVDFDGRRLRIPFFGVPHTITRTEILDPDGRRPTPPIIAVLRDYVLHRPGVSPRGNHFVSYRELDGAGPLAVNFANNTNKTITSTFSGQPDELKRAAAALSGIVRPDTQGYDLLIRFEALPGVPIHLLFNDAEASFPAQCSLLLQATIETYLDERAIYTLGTFLCGRLAGSRYDSDS